MELFIYFRGTLLFVLFFLLLMFHVFIRPKLSLVWTLSYIIGFVGLVTVISVVILFSIYQFQTVFLLPCIIIYSLFRFLYSVGVDLGGYHWSETCLILLAVLYQLQNITNRYVVSKFRWIRRECKLLDAVCNDISTLQVGEINDDAGCQISTTLSPEMMRLPLPESWVEKTKPVVDNAKLFIQDFPALSRHFFSKQLLFLHLNKVVSISNKISEHWQEKESVWVEGIYNELEKRWSTLQSQEDMEIEDQSGSASPGELVKKVTTITGEVTRNLSKDRRKKIELKLVLLQAFLKDLKYVKLERAIEKAWLEEMNDFLDDIHNAFATFRQRNKGLGLHRPLGKELLDREVGWMADGLTELLEAKKKFGFKFTIIQHQTRSDQNDDIENEDLILSVVNKIRTHPFNPRINLFAQAEAQIQVDAQPYAQILEEPQTETVARAEAEVQVEVDAPAPEPTETEEETHAHSLAPEEAEPELEVEALALEQPESEEEALALEQPESEEESLALEQPESEEEALSLEQPESEEEALALEQSQARARAYARAQAQAQAQAQAVADVEADPEIMFLCNKLEKMYNRLKAIDSPSSFRLVGLKQMKKIGNVLEKAFQNYIEETFPIRLETSKIKGPIKDLERFILAHDFKIKRNYRSVIGLEEDTDALVNKLTTGSEQRCVFSIVGMKGIGKTTLARKVYRHRQISRHFPTCRWVSVPIIPDNNDGLLENVGNQIITTNASQHKQEEGEIEENYSMRIRNFLEHECYLVVLDNVPTMEVWHVLNNVFPEGRNRSRILLTTSDVTLASVVDHNREPHQLRLRTKEESWELFLEKVQLSAELLSQNELLKKTKQVVERCWGLPLLLMSLVRTLNLGNTVDSLLLSGVFNQENQFQHLWSETSHISGLSNDLSSLISYVALFPKNYEIPARRLFALWIAEDLVQQSADGTNTLEKIAEDCLSELISLNLIQPMENSIHGKVRTCRLPEPLRDLLLHLPAGTFSARLADHCDPNDASFNLIHGAERPANEWRNYESLNSLISFDIHKGDKPGMDIGSFLRKGIENGCFKKLKVLDLERVFRPQLPKTIGKLSELRYLGLKWTYLENIPSTIGNLSKLQTLDLKHTYIHTLPVTIWKMQELRHLYLNQTYRSKFVHQSKTKSLDNLQTLSGVFLDKNSPLKDRLDELKSLRKLGLAFQLSLEQQVELARKISNLEHLQSLKLKSVNNMSEPQGLHLGDFSGLNNLSNIYLFGRLESAFRSTNFPDALSDLTLSSSGLENDPMPILGRLRNLKSLCLFSNSYTREDMACSRECFPQLLVLKIWKLGRLKDWTIEEEAMQNLKELEIRCCRLLNVPDGLKHLKTLRQLKLRNMSATFHERCSGFVPLSIIDTKTLPNQD